MNPLPGSPNQLSDMMTNDVNRVLVLTNDDGVDAPGLEAMRSAALDLGERWIVAPSGPYSGCGHRVTTHHPITVARRAADRLVVDGTPADCVRLAVHHLVPGVSWVLSGINAGGNLGTDVYHSGTVAAVREAVIHGVPGIAISHYIARGRAIDWPRATGWAAAALRELLARPWEPGTFWNVNLPHPGPDEPEPRLVDCLLDPSPLPLNFQLEGDTAHYSGDYQKRARLPSRDVDVCFGGNIAVTLVKMDGAGA
jgi:5'-nucleotidase